MDQDSQLIGWIFLAALAYSAVGHAGASGYQAAMGWYAIPAAMMKSVSLLLNIIVASIGSFQFIRAGHFRWQLFWPFAVASIPAAFLGGLIKLPEHYYKPLIGLMLWYSAVRLWWTAQAQQVEEIAEPKFPKLHYALVSGAAIGFLAGLTKTGGGIFLTPLILLMGWAKTKQTAAVSVVFILVNSIAGLAGQLSSDGLELPPQFYYWIIAVIVGGMIGSYLGSRKFGTPTLRRILAVVLIVAGEKLIRALWS